MSEILQEAENLVKSSAKELLIVAQDTAAYGLDLKYRKELINGQMLDSRITTLATELGKLGIWIRLHYLYPYPVLDQLIELMAKGVILPYLDMPLQHASPKILKAMRRPARVDNMLAKIENYRKLCPELTIRTTLITGFPGETVEDFDRLHDFIKDIKFDWLGVFTYSDVEGAPANNLPEQIDEEIKELRRDIILSTQEKLSADKLALRIGNIETVVVDEITEDYAICRSQAEAPEVDGVIKVEKNKNLKPGEMLQVKINRADIQTFMPKLYEYTRGAFRKSQFSAY